MDYVGRNTSVPVPKIITAFRTTSGREFILMTRIHGKTLQAAFGETSEAGQKSYLDQLRGYINELRALKPPNPPFICSIIHGSLEDERGFHGHIGPFSQIQDFHSTLVGYYDHVTGDSEQERKIQRILDMYRSRQFSIKLTHGDLAFRNIIANKGQIVGIVDWEMSGWLPDYWEFICTHYSFFNLQGWRPRIREFLEPFEVKLSAERVRRTIFANM